MPEHGPETGQDRHETGQDTGQDRYDVSQAALRLGISEDAVRKRIRRGKLLAEKVGAQWFVLLSQDTLGTGQDRTEAHDRPDSEPIEAEYRVSLEADRRHQLEALRETLLVPLIEANERQGQRIAELEREAGKLESERDTERTAREAAEIERDRLRDELAQAQEAAQARLRPLSTTDTTPTASAPQRAGNGRTEVTQETPGETVEPRDPEPTWHVRLAWLIVVIVITGGALGWWYG